MTVYVLVAILVNIQPITNHQTITIEKMVFKDAARCIRNARENEKRLASLYNQVKISCEEQKIIQ